MSPECVCAVLYLVTVEHLLHHAFMFRRVVAVVGGCEGSVRTGAEKKRVLNQQVTGTLKLVLSHFEGQILCDIQLNY